MVASLEAVVVASSKARGIAVGGGDSSVTTGSAKLTCLEDVLSTGATLAKSDDGELMTSSFDGPPRG